MTTIDNLLLTIVNHNTPTIEEQIAPRDSRVLRSLASTLSSHLFITENQAGLILKILRENSRKLKNFTEEIDHALTSPEWSKSFRKIEQIRKLYIHKNEDHESTIRIEFTFSSEIRKILSVLDKKLDDLTQGAPGKNYSADLTEKNIVTLVDALTPHNFEIDETIKNHYLTIKSWSEFDIQNQFLITNIEHKNFQKAITEDLGLSTTIDQNIINDRSMRYQYRTDIIKNPGETLVEYLANRIKPKVWVDKTQHTPTEIISSLQELHRLPLLVVFDNLVNDKYNTNLDSLIEALDANNIFDKIGVYFRLPNDDIGLKFNKKIKERQYNYNLMDNTRVAVVQSGKLPKFFLKSSWTPMSVIAFDTKMGLRHGKTSVYANCCDLIIEWAEKEVMFDNRLTIK
jgi:cephalosporin hydroxylase